MERVLKPIERFGHMPQVPFIYQPMFMKNLSDKNTDDLYDTAYVKLNVLDFDSRRGALFLERGDSVVNYGAQRSSEWVPRTRLTVRETYKIGRRWAYNQLEKHAFAKNHNGFDGHSFHRFHERLLSFYEDELKL